MDADRAWVDRAQHGDLDAFGELVRTHQHRLVRYLRAMMGDVSDAEDAAQDAFLRAHRALPQFKGTSTFKTWLYQIATNVARSALSKRRVDPMAAAVDARDEDRGETGVESLESPERFEAAVEARDRVSRALAFLPDELRTTVVLRDIEGFDYREIAAMLDVPIGTVESRIFRGRQRLRAALETEKDPAGDLLTSSHPRGRGQRP